MITKYLEKLVRETITEMIKFISKPKFLLKSNKYENTFTVQSIVDFNWIYNYMFLML